MTKENIVFSNIFKDKTWGDGESISGPGSSLRETRFLRQELPFLLKKYGIHSILDIPCGDFNWMKEVDLSGYDYCGADIVPDLIEFNKQRFPNINFKVMNLLADELPAVDLIICRDCLFHFPFEVMKVALNNIKRSGSKYVLTTSHTWLSVPGKDIEMGDFRKINLQKPPINLPNPVDFIIEGNGEFMQQDRCMCLWECESL
jgi:2-polyprenyl-3-methyl-5-hydroxy-6-metoxy-1,4-benzoquinol methylase